LGSEGCYEEDKSLERIHRWLIGVNFSSCLRRVLFAEFGSGLETIRVRGAPCCYCIERMKQIVWELVKLETLSKGRLVKYMKRLVVEA